MSKKILIVCKGFYPENSPRSFRATELALEFARQGHEVAVLTPFNEEHLEYGKKNNFRIVSLGKLKWGLPNFGKSKIGYLVTRVIVRLMQLAFEYPEIELYFKVKKALRGMKGYDILISVAVPYPIHWGVAAVFNRGIAKVWVADCGDPYYGEKTDTFRKWIHFSYIEKWFMRKADFITIPIESAKEGYFSEFHSKIKVIPQGFKFTTNHSQFVKKHNFPVFIYAGSFIPGKRDPGSFLEYLSLHNAQFKFIIYTNQSSLIEPYKMKLKEKIEVHHYISRNELLTRMQRVDFLVNFENGTDVQSPSKLIDYAIVNKPVLNIRQRLDKETIDSFLSGDYSKKLQVPDLSSFRIEKICSDFLNLANFHNNEKS